MRISDWSSDVCSSDLIGDILNVANLVRAAPNLQQRIISGRSDVGRIEKQRVREARAPAGGELPVLALDVMDDRRSGPAQQGRNDQPNALAAARRREGHDMFGAVMT